MSILKAELKQMVTHEIGVRVEDALESAKRELSLLEGRQTAFLDGAKSVEALLKAVDEDITAEKYDLATGEVAKRYILRAVQALSNLSQQASNYRMAQSGKVQGFDHTIKLLANIIEIEKKKVSQLQQAGPSLSSVPPPAEVEGAEPPRHLSIKERRLAEEAAPQAAAESVASVAPPAEESEAEAEAEASEPVEEEPSKKRRKGKRRAANA